MKRLFSLLVILSTTCVTTFSQEPKLVSDCVVEFVVSVEDSKADPQIIKSMEGSTRTVYIHGSKSRTDLITPAFKQTIIFDSKSDSTIILRELGATRYISYLNSITTTQKNKKYEGIQFNSTTERKTILGYECEKVIAKLADGSAYSVYFTRTIIPSNKEYEYQFKDLPGFVLEYEAQSEDEKTKVKYTATKITLVPVPVAKFDIPKSGYRVL